MIFLDFEGARVLELCAKSQISKGSTSKYISLHIHLHAPWSCLLISNWFNGNPRKRGNVKPSKRGRTTGDWRLALSLGRYPRTESYCKQTHEATASEVYHRIYLIISVLHKSCVDGIKLYQYRRFCDI